MSKPIVYQDSAMYPKQKAAIYDPKRFSVIEAGTKCGKTVGCLEWFLRQALGGKEGRNYWWVAPVFLQAEIGFRRMRLQLPREIFKANASKLTITLANGATMWFKSGERSDDLYGEDVYAAVMDEASRMRLESWDALLSTVNYTKGPVRLIGNVKGKKNWFYQLCRDSEAGLNPDFAYHKMTCWDAVEAGVLDREEIEMKRREYERQGRLGAFQQLYEAEASADGDNPFGLQAIQDCIASDFSDQRPFVAGVDLAGRGAQNQNVTEFTNRDYAAIVLLDKTGHMTYMTQFRGSHTEVEERVIRTVRRTTAMVDSTGQGDATVERLQKRGDMRVEGLRFTENSRQDLLEGLALAIGEGRVRFPDVPGENGAPSLVEQLESFEYDYSKANLRYSAPKGMHDDAVMALALAVRKMPIRRKAKDAPMEMPKAGGSQWTDNAEDAAWAAYKASLPPTKTGYLEQPEEKRGIPLPMVVGRASRWGGAG